MGRAEPSRHGPTTPAAPSHQHQPHPYQAASTPAQALHLTGSVAAAARRGAGEAAAPGGAGGAAYPDPGTPGAARRAKFAAVLASEAGVLDLPALRDLSWSGIPLELRARCWRLLTGFAPPSRSRQGALVEQKRREYRHLADALAGDGPGAPDRAGEELATWRQVALDVPRTAPEVPALRAPRVQAALQRLLYVRALRSPGTGYVQGINDVATAFLWTFLSELVPPRGDPAGSAVPAALADAGLFDACPGDGLAQAEADAYGCLACLLDQLHDNYTTGQPGIQRAVFRCRELCRRIDQPLSEVRRPPPRPRARPSARPIRTGAGPSDGRAGGGTPPTHTTPTLPTPRRRPQHLEEIGVDFLQFAFRWINCLLVRELPFRLVPRLFDTFVASLSEVQDWLVYVCTAFLVQWTEELREMDFGDAIQFLQRPPTEDWTVADLDSLLSRAYLLRATFRAAPSHLSHLQQ